jgi:hypothetical protein
MHLVKAFTQLQIKKILSKYILKRYSRDAWSIDGWDRNDIVRGGRDGSEEETRFTKLVPLMMGIARAGSKSDGDHAASGLAGLRGRMGRMVSLAEIKKKNF